jgi:hypothetical protein
MPVLAPHLPVAAGRALSVQEYPSPALAAIDGTARLIDAAAATAV